MQRFTELKIWQRSHQLALDIYRVTSGFPRVEQFGVTSQMRRAAVSVCANIAEGAKRRSNPDYGRLLNVAEGSLAETEALLRLSQDLGFSDLRATRRLLGEAEEIARMIAALRRSVETAGGSRPRSNC
jgi:four helix bundle protein